MHVFQLHRVCSSYESLSSSPELTISSQIILTKSLSENSPLTGTDLDDSSVLKVGMPILRLNSSESSDLLIYVIDVGTFLRVYRGRYLGSEQLGRWLKSASLKGHL